MESIKGPARVVTPGRIIERELEERGWQQSDLARIMGRPAQAISEIINAKKQITAETARELAAAFGTSAEFWTQLEANYRLHLAARNAAEAAIERKAAIHSKLPYGDLVRRGWLPEREDVDEQEQDVCRFLGIAAIGDPVPIALSAHHSTHGEPEIAAEVAWARRVVRLVTSHPIEPYDRTNFDNMLRMLLDATVASQMSASVPSTLHDFGIHFAIVPHLPKTYLDGAAFWHGSNPVVALTMHYDRLDHFWFALLHELAHIRLGHAGVRFDRLDRDDDLDDEECEANRLAEDWLLDRDAYERFVATAKLTAANVRAFSQSQRRHPAIVAGRLRHDGVIKHQQLTTLNAKVKEYLQEHIDCN